MSAAQLGPYRSAALTIVDKSHAPRYRVVREPYRYKSRRVRYLIQEQRRFLWWSWWKTIEWHFDWHSCREEIREMRKVPPTAAVIWQEGDDPDAVQEPAFPSDDEDDDADDLDDDDDLDAEDV